MYLSPKCSALWDINTYASVGGLNGGVRYSMLATWWVRKALGEARPSPYWVRSVAPGRRDCLAGTRSTFFFGNTARSRRYVQYRLLLIIQ